VGVLEEGKSCPTGRPILSRVYEHVEQDLDYSRLLDQVLCYVSILNVAGQVEHDSDEEIPQFSKLLVFLDVVGGAEQEEQLPKYEFKHLIFLEQLGHSLDAVLIGS